MLSTYYVVMTIMIISVRLVSMTTDDPKSWIYFVN